MPDLNSYPSLKFRVSSFKELLTQYTSYLGNLHLQKNKTLTVNNQLVLSCHPCKNHFYTMCTKLASLPLLPLSSLWFLLLHPSTALLQGSAEKLKPQAAVQPCATGRVGAGMTWMQERSITLRNSFSKSCIPFIEMMIEGCVLLISVANWTYPLKSK